MTRAVVVVAVVLNHSLDGLTAAGLLSADGLLGRVNHVLYLLRMPALAFLVGLFVPGSLARRGTSGYLRERAVTLLWLYLVWSLVQGAVEVATNGLRNGRRDASSVLVLWEPQAHLWFLPFLFVATVVVTIANTALRAWRRPSRGWPVLAVLVGLALLTWGWTPEFIGLRGLPLVLFVALGCVVGTSGLVRLERLPARWWWAGGVASLALLLLIAADAVPSTVPSATDLDVRGRGLLAALAGTVAVVCLGRGLTALAPARGVLVAIGRRTLPIYLMHVLLVAGVRIVLVRAGVDVPVVVLVVAVVVGVAVPVVAASCAPRLRLGWFFDRPRSSTRAVLPA